LGGEGEMMLATTAAAVAAAAERVLWKRVYK